MTELVVYGRGGQGGVTLAKLIATAYFLRGKHAQAFGVYAAERSGAPLQAFVRIDDEEITNHNLVREPDHVVVLDRTLIGPSILEGLHPGGWIVLNTPQPPEGLVPLLAGRNVATLDATAIAIAHGLGTRTVPIVNTTMFGAVARALDLTLEDITAALSHTHLGGANVSAAEQAFRTVRMQRPAALEAGAGGEAAAPARPTPGASRGRSVAGILDPQVGAPPRLHTGDWATRRPVRRRLTPPCNHSCPAGNDVQAFVQAAARGDYDGALEVLLKTSPFPGVCGRVCPAPCMEACNRGQYDESVNVRELERYVADRGRRPAPSSPWRRQEIAVVGSGPAGLSASYHLARLGYPVTIFEAGRELGGLMRTGIPTYRLPRDVLDAEISHVVRHGVQVRTGVAVDRHALLGLTQAFAAVFVATGQQQMSTLDLGRLAGDRIVQGIRFLERARRGQETAIGQRVVVVGGGNTAIDAARTARRLGARQVRVLYRRTRAEMPAIREEVEDALSEGIELAELVSPLHARADGTGAILTCVRMRLGEPDESGRPRPVPETSEDAYFDVACDRIILALGQSSDLSIVPEGTSISQDGRVIGQTDAPVFLGGDLATGEGTVTAAIGNGQRAALRIHAALSGEKVVAPDEQPVASRDVLHLYGIPHQPREEALVLPARVRRETFAEVRQGLVDEPGRCAARIEAQRCFSCGVCNYCDTCVAYCPEGVLVREGEGYAFDFDYCKGCGVCASVCPRGVIVMTEL